jgi:hypothetical protein
MSNDAPAAFVNPPDSMVTTDAYRACPTWIGWRSMRNARWQYEKLARTEVFAGTARQVPSHGHGALATAPDDGLVIRKSVINDLFAEYSAVITTGDWTEIARGRGSGASFVDLACEVKFSQTQPVGGETMRFKIESCEANDSAACGAVDYDLTEAVGDATDHSAGAQWHTINESAGDGKELTTDAVSQREYILSARAVGGSSVLTITHWRVWEIVTGDL